MLSLWAEIRTAYHVARLGKVSQAAEELGVHHATIIRHIDALEERLGARLFQRHARGYTPTEAGQDLLKVGQATEEQFGHLVARIRGGGEEIGGELIVTAIPTLDAVILPVIGAFQDQHPALRVRYIADVHTYRLSYGEAHVALRAGQKPSDPDNVVRSLPGLPMRLVAARAYIERYGRPERIEDLARHRFIGFQSGDMQSAFGRWLERHVPADRFVVVSPQPYITDMATALGLGIGFLPGPVAAHRGGAGAAGGAELVDLFPDLAPPEWCPPLWLVTHVDLHRTPKVRQFSAALIEASRHW